MVIAKIDDKKYEIDGITYFVNSCRYCVYRNSNMFDQIWCDKTGSPITHLSEINSDCPLEGRYERK